MSDDSVALGPACIEGGIYDEVSCRVEARVTESSDDHACSSFEFVPSHEPGRVAPGQPARVDRPALPPDIPVEKFPRYVIFERARKRLVLRKPGVPRSPEFTGALWLAYLRRRGQSVPIARDRSTWGPAREVGVPYCELTGSQGARELVFRPGSGQRWTIYNLDLEAQPEWGPFLKRTLAFFPAEHLANLPHGASMSTLYLDFRVGDTRLGPSARVGSGGTNVGGPRPLLLIAYAALNRWSHRATASEPAIDAWYSLDAYRRDSQRVASTAYHEFAHIFTPRGLNRSDVLWSQYFWGLLGSQDYGGLTWGPGEAFSEAYRYRMLGRNQPSAHFSEAARSRLIREKLDPLVASAERRLNEATRGRAALERGLRILQSQRERCGATATIDGDLGPMIDSVLDQLGVPTLSSVVRARAAIIDHLQRHPSLDG